MSSCTAGSALVSGSCKNVYCVTCNALGHLLVLKNRTPLVVLRLGHVLKYRVFDVIPLFSCNISLILPQKSQLARDLATRGDGETKKSEEAF